MDSIDLDDLFPEGGWDTHHHIFEPQRFPYSPNRHLTPPQAAIADFESFKSSHGITHSVLVHGLSYGDDCSSLKAFITGLGESVTQGIAVINEDTSDCEIEELHSHGIRGIRMDLYRYKAMEDVKKQVELLKLYADRIRPKGWSLDFLQLKPENYATLGRVIPALSLPVVTDHHALLKAQSMLPSGVDVLSQPGLSDVVSLLKTGSFWVKLSAPYRCSEDAPHYADMKPLVRALVDANPRRVLWGSDWPHTPRMQVRSHKEALTESPFRVVDDRAWLVSLKSWLTEQEWRFLMVLNPEALYGW